MDIQLYMHTSEREIYNDICKHREDKILVPLNSIGVWLSTSVSPESPPPRSIYSAYITYTPNASYPNSAINYCDLQWLNINYPVLPSFPQQGLPWLQEGLSLGQSCSIGSQRASV